MVGMDITNAVLHITQGRLKQEALNFETLRMDLRVDLHLPSGAQDIKMNLGRGLEAGKADSHATATAKAKAKKAKTTKGKNKNKGFWSSVRDSVRNDSEQGLKEKDVYVSKRLHTNSEGVSEEHHIDSYSDLEADIDDDDDRFNSDSDDYSSDSYNSYNLSDSSTESESESEDSVFSSSSASARATKSKSKGKNKSAGGSTPAKIKTKEITPTAVEMVEPYFTEFYHRYIFK